MTFWTDPKIDEDFTPEDKYFYLYLLTNPHTNLCGCYEIGFKQMARETGYNEDTVKHLVNRLEAVHNVIRYSGETKELLLLNWHKHNWSASEDTLKGVSKSASTVKSQPFRDYISALLNRDTPSIDPLQTPYRPPIDPRETSVTVTVTDSVTDTETVSDSFNSNNKEVGKASEERRQDTEEYGPDFEIFWNEYPRKVGKKEAYRAFRKVREPLSVLLDAVRLQKESEMWAKENGRFIPNPATWLNQGRWEDQVTRKAGNRFMQIAEALYDDNGNLKTPLLDIVNLQT
ncbi:MAG: hypothetical protein IJM49_02870 [Firmicutes bacterium]|nr:hypothetical protein [Bacillota bacterium]